MKLNVQALCRKGPIRENNEDMVSVGGILLRDSETEISFDTDTDRCHFFVADGMGGHDKGEEASSFLLETLRDCFSLGDFDESLPEMLQSTVECIGAKLNARAVHEGQSRPMGTTLTGVVFLKDKVWMVNSGDSRTYRFHDGLITQLSTDEVGRMGGLTGCIGGGMESKPVIEDITDRVEEDDILLICSDGLSGAVWEDELEYFLVTSANPAEELYDRALLNGTTDNVSIILVRIGDKDFGDDGDFQDDDGRFDAWA